MKKIFTAVTTGLVLTVSASATDLVNKDSVKYDVKIHATGTLNTSVGSNTTMPISGCMSGCTVEVIGVGSLKITGKEKSVVIEKGKLTVR